MMGAEDGPMTSEHDPHGEPGTDPVPVHTRRRVLALIGGAGAALAAAACTGGSGTREPVAASGSTSTTATTAAAAAASTSTTAAAAPATTVATCVLTPEMTEGPYYIAGETIRADVTDGRPGIPLRLDLTVLDATACTPIAGATVEIWHADAGGVYSGFGSGASSRTFLRCVQVTGADGKVEFQTIYPGWYAGRATHIHLKVLVNGTTHTSQLFFPEAVNNAAYAVAPYSSHTGTRTMNSQDSIFGGGGTSTTVAVTGSTTGYTAAINLGVKK